jgi:gliding motility-associated-like protein
MTLRRSFAILSFCAFLISTASGQQVSSWSGSSHLSASQLFMLDSLASDSIPGELAVPNVFTPNGDGINDYFEVSTDGIRVYEFSIFTRTGTRVFYSQSPRIFWDGKSDNGQELKEGVYYFVIEETGDEAPFEQAGFMHLYR